MLNKKKNAFKSVLSINPYADEYISAVSSHLTITKKASYEKEQFVCSYINTKSYIHNKIEINKNIPNEDIVDAINIKVYDELGLDQGIEYEIQTIETFHNLDGDNRVFQVFLVDPLELETTFTSTVDKIKYIDTIIPSPLLIKSLYSKEIIENANTHCFIYFEEEDAFLSIYSEKEYIYSKSLKYSLYEMHERFCQIYGENVEYSSFISFLEDESLKHTQNDYKDSILQLYKELFSNITDVLTYTKKAYNINQINHIYIGSQINMASKLDEIAEVELSIASSDFNFDYGFNSDDHYVDQLQSLLQVTAMLNPIEKYSCNFSIFHRPPKLIHRPSGKILALIAASLFIAFAYPLTYWSLMYSQELQHQLLEQEYLDIHYLKSTREATIKTKEADKTKVMTLLKEEKKHYVSKKKTLVKIHDVKVNYPMKAKMITELTKNLNKFDVKTEDISYKQTANKKTFILELVSKKSRNITELLEYTTQKYQDSLQFSLYKINFDKERKEYLSKFEVSIK